MPQPEAPRLLTLVAMPALAIMSLTMFLPSLAGMAADFGVSYATMSLAISGYFVLTAVVQISAGPLSDRFGRRPVALWGFAIFAASSAMAALAPSFEVFLAARVAQSAVVVGTALPPAVVRDIAAPERAAGMLGRIGMTMALAPMVGPLIGGVLDTGFGWRANFVVYTLCGAAVFLLVLRTLPETNKAQGRTLSKQLRAYPLLLKDRRYWAYALTIAFSISIFYVFITGAPLVGAAAFGMSTTEVGLAMAVTPSGFILGNYLTSRAAERVPLTRLAVVGRWVTLICVGAALLLGIWGAPAALFFLMFAGVGIGNGLSVPTSQTGATSVRPDLAGSAAGLAGALTVGFGALATGLTGSVLANRPEPMTLALLMLCVSLLALVAALAAQRADRAALAEGRVARS